MKITDKTLMRRIRDQARGRCEFCFCFSRSSLEVHHILGRGPGRVDIPGNLIALCGAWDNNCHAEAQRYEIDREVLFHITAAREHTTAAAIEAEVYRIRRAHKYAEVRRDA